MGHLHEHRSRTKGHHLAPTIGASILHGWERTVSRPSGSWRIAPIAPCPLAHITESATDTQFALRVTRTVLRTTRVVQFRSVFSGGRSCSTWLRPMDVNLISSPVEVSRKLFLLAVRRRLLARSVGSRQPIAL